MAKSHRAETKFVLMSVWQKSKGSKILRILPTYFYFKSVSAIPLSVEHLLTRLSTPGLARGVGVGGE